MQKTSKNLFEFDLSFTNTIIGTDEAGRGPAAGGVFASAVYFPNNDKKLIDKLSGGKQSQLVVLDVENIKILDKTFKQRVENQLLQTKRFAKNIVSTLKDIIFRDF